MTKLSLDKAIVLVTGANGGIGTQFVQQALERGATKVYATARTPKAWNDDRIVPLPLDVLSAESINETVRAADDTTVVVNNAGIYPPVDSLLHGDQNEFRRIFETNFFAAVEIVRAFAPTLAKNGGGAYVNVGSAASWRAGNGAYSASKAALWMATNALRLELLDQGTHTLGLYMGYVDTPMVAHEDVEKVEATHIVRVTYDALESGAYEALGDDVTRSIKAKLSLDPEAMYSELTDRVDDVGALA